MSFSFAEFESGIRSLTEVLKQHSEIICTLPTAGAGGEGIGFTLMAGSGETREALAAAANLPVSALEEVPRTGDGPLPEVLPPAHRASSAAPEDRRAARRRARDASRPHTPTTTP